MKKYKEEKKNRKKISKRQKLEKNLQTAVCLLIVASMILSPIAIYVSQSGNTQSGSELSETYNYNVASSSDALESETFPIVDDNSNVIGHMHSDGTTHMDNEEE